MYFIRNYRYYIYKGIFIIIILILSIFTLTAQDGISNYKVCFAVGDYNNKSILVIRKYEQLGQLFYIGVDPESLETLIISSKQINIKL